MHLAASGSPNRMLTLTCAASAEPDPVKARALLHRSWRALRLKIAREFVKPSVERWRIGRARARTSAGNKTTADVLAPPPLKPSALPYFAVVERHKSGRPHLHVLLRCGYIPQTWLSLEMNRLAGSPIVDIRKVSGTKQAAAYVAKYIGKAPAKFGNSRAYWYTKNWAPAAASDEKPSVTQAAMFSARPWSWEETRAEVLHWRPLIDVTADGWFSLQPRASPHGATVVRGRYPPMFERGPPGGPG